eukprot:Rhum_TRINITY_DN4435_c0_g1::Rhum_TRINITY_DN4435_c0_g1_i1::g.14315::m.14315
MRRPRVLRELRVPRDVQPRLQPLVLAQHVLKALREGAVVQDAREERVAVQLLDGRRVEASVLVRVRQRVVLGRLRGHLGHHAVRLRHRLDELSQLRVARLQLLQAVGCDAGREPVFAVLACRHALQRRIARFVRGLRSLLRQLAQQGQPACGRGHQVLQLGDVLVQLAPVEAPLLDDLLLRRVALCSLLRRRRPDVLVEQLELALAVLLDDRGQLRARVLAAERLVVQLDVDRRQGLQNVQWVVHRLVHELLPLLLVRGQTLLLHDGRHCVRELLVEDLRLLVHVFGVQRLDHLHLLLLDVAEVVQLLVPRRHHVEHFVLHKLDRLEVDALHPQVLLVRRHLLLQLLVLATQRGHLCVLQDVLNVKLPVLRLPLAHRRLRPLLRLRQLQLQRADPLRELLRHILRRQLHQDVRRQLRDVDVREQLRRGRRGAQGTLFVVRAVLPVLVFFEGVVCRVVVGVDVVVRVVVQIVAVAIGRHALRRPVLPSQAPLRPLLDVRLVREAHAPPPPAVCVLIGRRLAHRGLRNRRVAGLQRLVRLLLQRRRLRAHLLDLLVDTLSESLFLFLPLVAAGEGGVRRVGRACHVLF